MMKYFKISLALSVVLLATTTPSIAGVKTGPTRTVERVLGNGTDSYKPTFIANQSAVIEVRGDGDTDLDLYIYDSLGNLIEKDEDLTDHCVVRWTPRWTGEFTVRIKNRGSLYNNYVMTTN